jgi:hypothetical protein
MHITWKVSRRQDTRTPSTGGQVVSWIALIAGVAVAVVGAIGLWTELGVTLHGIQTTAKVIEHHHATASGRMASIVAQVEVAVPNRRAFRAEVEDQFAVAEWVDGGTVNVICTKLAHCEMDSMLDRWLTPALFLVVGLGVVRWRRFVRGLMRVA